MATVQVQVNQTGPTSSEGVIRDHKVPVDRPEAKGGADTGAMGGELLLASLGGCFMSTLLAAVQARAADVNNVRVQVEGTLDGSPSRFTAIHMTVAADADDKAQLEKLVTIAERSCIVANTLKDALELSVTLDG